MLTDQEQRWRDGRDRWVNPTEVYRPGRYKVEKISDAEAKAFVVQHH